MADELLRALGMRQASPPPGLEDTLLAPLEGPERTALLDDVMARLEPRESPHAPSTPAATAPVVELATRRRATRAWVGAATALAAALLLWLGLREPTAPPEAALPPYTATRLDGGTAVMRSSADDPPPSLSLRPDATIDWILTPRSPVRTAVGAVLLATSPGREPHLVVPPRLEVSDEGVVRIAGPLAEVLPLPPGTWSVTVVLGPPDALPRTVAAAQDHDDGPPFSRVAFEAKISDAP